jgi:hypothetical protein
MLMQKIMMVRSSNVCFTICNPSEIAELLIAKVQMLMQKIMGKKALMFALQYSKPDIAELLFSKGVDVNEKR